MHRRQRLVLAITVGLALVASACGSNEPETEATVTPTTSSTTTTEADPEAEPTTSTTASTSSSITTTEPAPSTSIDEGEAVGYFGVLGLVVAGLGLEPTEDQSTCMTDESKLRGLEEIDATTLAFIAAQMCMPDELLAAQTASTAQFLEGATEEQIADVNCTLEVFFDQVEGLDLDGHIARQLSQEQSDGPPPEDMAEAQEICGITDEELDAIEALQS